MGSVELIFEAIASLIVIFLFAFVVFPALGQATNQDVTLYMALLLVLGVAVIFGIIMRIIK